MKHKLKISKHPWLQEDDVLMTCVNPGCEKYMFVPRKHIHNVLVGKMPFWIYAGYTLGYLEKWSNCLGRKADPS